MEDNSVLLFMKEVRDEKYSQEKEALVWLHRLEIFIICRSRERSLIPNTLSKKLLFSIFWLRMLMEICMILKCSTYRNLKCCYVIFLCMFDPQGRHKIKSSYHLYEDTNKTDRLNDKNYN